MKLMPVVELRTDDIRIKEELLLRPINEDHVAKLTVGYKWNSDAAPAIIIQKVSNALYARIHCHSFCALRRAGIEKIRCRRVEGEEWEIIALGLREQSQIEDFTPKQYHDNIIKIRDALIEKNGKCSFRDLEEHIHLKKTQIHRLVDGFSDDNVKELMDKGYSFTKAYREVHFVPLGDSQKVNEEPEEPTKPQDQHAGAQEGPHVDDEERLGSEDEDDSPKDREDEPSEELTTPEDPQDGEAGTGEPASTTEGKGSDKELDSPPGTPPSTWAHGWYCSTCGQFLPDGTEKIVKLRNDHEKEHINNGNYGNEWQGIFIKAERLTRKHPFSPAKGIPDEYKNMDPRERDAAINNIELLKRECKTALGFLNGG